MSVIQSIRDKYAKVMFFVIVLALLGFILMYATNDVRGLFGRSNAIGSIDGNDVDYKEYQDLVSQMEDQERQQNPSLDENTQAQIRDQAWNTLVNDKLMGNVNDKLGLMVTPAEIKDMISGPNPDPQIRQIFTDSKTGQYDAQRAISTVQQLDRMNPKNDQETKQKEAWETFKQNLIKSRLSNKFNNLVTGAIYTPKAMLDAMDKERNTYASVKFVQLPYTLVNDNEVKVSDDEIKKYMEAHRSIFELDEPSRSVEYVTFNVIPSAADSAKVYNSLDTLKGQMASTTDSNMENFIMRNSETQNPVVYQTKKTLQKLPNADELLSAPAGTIVGPFLLPSNKDSRYFMAKILEKRNFSDSVSVRHILVQTQDPNSQQVIRDDSSAKSRMDSVVAMLHSGIPFDSLVSKYSDDPGSNTKGGVITSTFDEKGNWAPEFGDFMFEGKKGETKVVKTVFGYHYIEVLYQAPTTQSASKIAFVSKILTPDQSTETDIYNKATAFATKVSTDPKSFDKNAQAAGLQKQNANGINENSDIAGQMGASRELVRWAYKANIGDVSSIIRVGDKYVVAKLTGIQDAGLMAITPDIRPQLEEMVKRGKKAKILIDRNKGKALDAIAQTENQQITTDDSVTFARAKSAIGQEPKAQGYVFCKNFKENTVYPGIEGNMGVFFIAVNSRGAAANSPDRNPQQEQMMSSMMVKQNAANMVLYSMRQKAKVKDKRGKFYNN